MAQVTLAIGVAAVCTDGFPGQLKSLVLDPSRRAVTHLVIEPEREHGPALGLARLVPFNDADASAEPIRLACTGAEFKDLDPAEQTLAEFVPGYEASFWTGVAAPKGTPAAIVDTLNKAVNASLADANVKARLAEWGATALTGSPADFAKFVADETEKWGKVIRAANIKAE